MLSECEVWEDGNALLWLDRGISRNGKAKSLSEKSPCKVPALTASPSKPLLDTLLSKTPEGETILHIRISWDVRIVLGMNELRDYPHRSRLIGPADKLQVDGAMT